MQYHMLGAQIEVHTKLRDLVGHVPALLMLHICIAVLTIINSTSQLLLVPVHITGVTGVPGTACCIAMANRSSHLNN
jgi:hypothetical protein